MNGKQVCQKLENEGWICKRIRGSHHIYGKEGQKPVPIPVHGRFRNRITLKNRERNWR
ncbi:MAG: type II toxin-antitoxin system HicA family toxin [Candidatus Parabeggiatoa sp.]|nr:type II toxin-antitoxin system HicA family toxin [Candidatus Parabeggiatoa sp.]